MLDTPSTSLGQAYPVAMDSREPATHLEALAWALYCKETAGCASARDFWDELSTADQDRYLARVSPWV